MFSGSGPRDPPTTAGSFLRAKRDCSKDEPCNNFLPGDGWCGTVSSADCDNECLDPCDRCDICYTSNCKCCGSKINGICCSTCILHSTYMTTACTAWVDTECAGCTQECPTGKYMSARCSLTANAKCTNCDDACSNGTYETTPCTTATNRVCTSCSPSCGSYTYESTACSRTSNRVCTPCATGCTDDQYIPEQCTTTASRGCKTCATCATGE